MTTKRQFLDPIGAGCRFILLKILQPKTKIRIHDHTIKLVDNNIFEKIIFRPWIYGDSREDIAFLYPMIVRFIELYLLETQNEKCLNCLKKIASYMIEGLEILEETYEYGNAVFTIHFYITLIKAGIDNTYSKKLLPQHLKDFTTENFLDDEKIKKIWTDDEIIELEELFCKCFDATQNERSSSIDAYCAAIYSMLESHDKKFKQMISSTNSS